jgi:hypothetical protein
MNRIIYPLLALFTLFALVLNTNLCGQEFVENDSLNLLVVQNLGNEPFFGYTDIDISGDYAIWETSDVSSYEVQLLHYDSDRNFWGTERSFSAPLGYGGSATRGPQVALSDSLGVFSMMKSASGGTAPFVNLQIIERNSENGKWNRGHLIRPYDLPDSIKSKTQIIRNDWQKGYGRSIDVGYGVVAVSAITKNNNIGLVFIYEKENEDWQVTQVL